MITMRNIINKHFPDFQLVNHQGNLFITNYSYEEVKTMMEKYLVPIPSDWITSKYKEKTYKNKEVYLLDVRYFYLKQSKNGEPYLFER